MFPITFCIFLLILFLLFFILDVLFVNSSKPDDNLDSRSKLVSRQQTITKSALFVTNNVHIHYFFFKIYIFYTAKYLLTF